MQYSKDLTEKPIFPAMTLFALPMLAGNLLQQLYNIVDTYVVGRYVGKEALAAVGAVFALMIFLTSVLLGLCMGSGVVFSHAYGEGRREDLTRYLSASFYAIFLIAALLTAAAYALVPSMLVWLNIPLEIRSETALYLRIVLAGVPAVFVYNFFAAYLKALGNSLTPLLFLAVSAVLNIALDLYAVLVLHLGIAGTAMATVIAQVVSALCCAAYCLVRDEALRRALGRVELRRGDLQLLGRYSLFTCLQQSVMNLGILMVQGVVNSFGVAVMAAFAAGVKIDAFAYVPAQEYGNAFSTFLSQNYGARRSDRVRGGIRCAVLTSGIYCLLASAVLYCFAAPLMRLFLDAAEVESIAIGVGYLHVEGVFYVLIGLLFLWYGLFRALARPEVSLLLTVVSLGTRVALSYAAAAIPTIGYRGIWWAIVIGWALADLCGLVLFLRLRKKEGF